MYRYSRAFSNHKTPRQMTEKEIIDAKIETFSELEILDKLQEELLEALGAVNNLHAAIRSGRPLYRCVRGLMEELADVEIAGRKTLVKLYPSYEKYYENKLRHGVLVQLRDAIEKAQGNSPCPLPGDECDHDGGCDTCPHAVKNEEEGQS